MLAPWPAVATAQSQVRPTCLDTARTQRDMTVCSGESFKAADRLLTKLLQDLRGQLPAPMIAQLDTAQAAWASYAAVQCRLESAPNDGGTVYSMAVTTCRRALVEDRIRQLAPLLCDLGTSSAPCPRADAYIRPFDSPSRSPT
jgi:uncharacterized protein YecT (DUF1311 family)